MSFHSGIFKRLEDGTYVEIDDPEDVERSLTELLLHRHGEALPDDGGRCAQPAAAAATAAAPAPARARQPRPGAAQNAAAPPAQAGFALLAEGEAELMGTASLELPAECSIGGRSRRCRLALSSVEVLDLADKQGLQGSFAYGKTRSQPALEPCPPWCEEGEESPCYKQHRGRLQALAYSGLADPQNVVKPVELSELLGPLFDGSKVEPGCAWESSGGVLRLLGGMHSVRAVVLLGPPRPGQPAAGGGGGGHPFGDCLSWLARQSGNNTAAWVLRCPRAFQQDPGRRLHWNSLLFFLRPLSGDGCAALRALAAGEARRLGGEAAAAALEAQAQAQEPLLLRLACFGFLGEGEGGGLEYHTRWLCLRLGPEGGERCWEAPERQAAAPPLPWFLAGEMPAGLSPKQQELWALQRPLIAPKKQQQRKKRS